MSEMFFNAIRPLFGGKFTQNQVDGLNFIFKATAHLPLRHQAYVLATAFHETGPASSPLHMTPRREIWGPTDAQRRYEGRADLGNTITGDGHRFLGRGYVQITGRRNYQKASVAVGKDLVANPDLALDPEIAVKVLVSGMEQGWFTGKKLADCSSYEEMRRVVNGTDRAELIAGYAKKFEQAIRAEAALASTTPTTPPVEAPVAPPAASVEVSPPKPDMGTPTSPPATAPEIPGAGPLIAKIVIGAVGLLVAAFAAWITRGGN